MLSSVFAWTECAPPRRISDSVFDNSVERASREKSFGHKSERSHKIDHWIFRKGISVVPSRLSSPAMAACLLPVGRHQVSNESLILAQNQRWRRA
jgi:hypothetical protein